VQLFSSEVAYNAERLASRIFTEETIPAQRGSILSRSGAPPGLVPEERREEFGQRVALFAEGFQRIETRRSEVEGGLYVLFILAGAVVLGRLVWVQLFSSEVAYNAERLARRVALFAEGFQRIETRRSEVEGGLIAEDRSRQRRAAAREDAAALRRDGLLGARSAYRNSVTAAPPTRPSSNGCANAASSLPTRRRRAETL